MRGAEISLSLLFLLFSPIIPRHISRLNEFQHFPNISPNFLQILATANKTVYSQLLSLITYPSSQVSLLLALNIANISSGTGRNGTTSTKKEIFKHAKRKIKSLIKVGSIWNLFADLCLMSGILKIILDMAEDSEEHCRIYLMMIICLIIWRIKANNQEKFE